MGPGSSSGAIKAEPRDHRGQQRTQRKALVTEDTEKGRKAQKKAWDARSASAGCIPGAPQDAPKKAKTRHGLVSVCACGANCTCNTVKAAPGKCTCGKDLKASHVLRVENDEALVCTCETGCTCQLDPKDATKCGCGKAVKRVNLKGTGIYFCNCGGTCECNTLSTKPGKCKCGMALKKSA